MGWGSDIRLPGSEFWDGRCLADRLYYAMMGWEPDTGLPGRAKLYELGLDWVVEEP
jgi:hypothetical protein